MPTIRRNQFDIAFGNITVWGRKPRKYLTACTADLVMFAETHLEREALDGADLRSHIIASGFKFVASAASPTGGGGNHGCTMLCIRRHLECKFFDFDPSPPIFSQWNCG